MLTELDGLDDRRNVFVIAATNRPDIIDGAMLRPGRLDKLLYVPLPGKEDRASILQTATRTVPLDKDVNLEEIAVCEKCAGFSGADIAALVREAQMHAVKRAEAEKLEEEHLTVSKSDFFSALQKVQPSVSKKDEARYKSL